MTEYYCPIHKKTKFKKHRLTFSNNNKNTSRTVIGWSCSECNKIYVSEKGNKVGILSTLKSGFSVENIYPNRIMPNKFYVHKKVGTQIPCGCKDNESINNFFIGDCSSIQIPSKYCSKCDKYYITLGTYNQCKKDILQYSTVEFIDKNLYVSDDNEINTNEMSKSLDTTTYDETNAENILNNEKYNSARKVAQAYLNSNIKYNPYQYLPWLHLYNDNKNSLLICDEVGLGKTIEAGILIKEELFYSKNSNILIICPAFLRNKWKEELLEKFYVDATIYKESGVFDSNIQILPLSRLMQFNEENKFNEYNLVIIDEAHYFKNRKSARYKHLNVLLSNNKYHKLVLMTATPINNSDRDYHAIRDILGYGFEKTSTTKKQAYIDLPKRNIKEIYVSLSNQEQEIYNTTDLLPAFSGTIYRHIGASCLYALIKYSTNGIYSELKDELYNAFEELLEEEYVEEELPNYYEAMSTLTPPDKDSKLTKLIELIQNCDNSKIVIFSHYIETVKYLHNELSKNYNCEYIYGNNFSNKALSINKKNRFLDAKKWFDSQTNDTKTILICSDSCKEGIDLDSASCLINYDLPFNPSILEQRIGRIDRMSQKNEMQIYNFHVDNTYDDRLHMILSSKLFCINYFAEYGIGNPLSITETQEDPFDKFIRYFKKNNFEMSNDDYNVLRKILRRINIKTKESIEQNEMLNILEENKDSIINLFNSKEIDVLTDEQLRVQKEILDRKLNFPKFKKGLCIIDDFSRENILNRLNNDINFRRKASYLITDYDKKLKNVEESGEPMIIFEEEINTELLFTSEFNGNNELFISVEIIDELKKEGVKVIWD